MTILINFLLVVNVIVCLLIIFVTLMQRPKNEGLGAAFGGGMTDNLFGAQTSNVLATFTRWVGGAFFVLALVLSMLYTRNVTAKSAVHKELLLRPRPLASATPAASPSDATGEASKRSVEEALKKAGVNIAPAGEATKTTPLASPANSATPAATPAAAPSATAVPSASPAAGAPSATPAAKP